MKYVIDFEKIDKATFAEDLMLLHKKSPEFAFDIMMVSILGITKPDDNVTSTTLRRQGLSYVIPIKKA